MHNQKYKISFFNGRCDTNAKLKELTFDELLAYFREVAHREFVAKNKLEAMICGELQEGKRTAENLTCRSIITYDIDYYKHDLDALVTYITECLKNNTYIYYSTVSSTPDKPKLRVLLFVNKNIEVKNYLQLSMDVAKDLFKDFFNEDNYVKLNDTIDSAIDKSSYSAIQLMYLPTLHTKGFRASKGIGGLLDIDKYPPLVDKEKSSEFQQFIRATKNIPLQITDDKVKEILVDYDVNDADYYAWIQVGQALHHQYKGGQKGLDLFIEWSLNDTSVSEKGRYENGTVENTCTYKYRSLKLNRLNPVTFASIIQVVNKKKLLPTTEVSNVELVQEIHKSKFVHLKLNAKGFVTSTKATYENFKIMCNHYGVKVNYDSITKRNVNSFNEDDDNLVAGRLSSLMVLNDMGDKLVHTYTNMLAHDNPINSFKDILDNTIWDGKSRLREFYDTVGVDDEFKETRDAYLLKWLQQMLYLTTFTGTRKVARQILVFQGLQDGGKSTWLMNLMPANLREHYIGEGLVLDSNHTLQRDLLSYVFVELAELEQSFKKTDINAFKAFFGRTKDKLNIKYLPYMVCYPRTTSFFGTINEKTFLKDKTGSTRFLVLPVKKLNGYHGIDMLRLYKEILLTIDYVNFELSEEDKIKQKLINEEFEQPDLIGEQFTLKFDTDFDSKVAEIDGVYVKYMTCTEILEEIGYTKRDVNYNRRLDLQAVLDKYKFKYRKDLKKWLVKIKNGDSKHDE